MSASLVGSEMCIRDRCMSEYVVLIAWLSPGAGAPRHLRMPCLNLVCAQSVSYTHLTLPTICSV
eukprot:1573319-Alexandrium_andersonii.AAC.1